jgi:hypothetical protein
MHKMKTIMQNCRIEKRPFGGCYRWHRAVDAGIILKELI